MEVLSYYRSKQFNFHFHHYVDKQVNKCERVKLDTHAVYEILYLADGNATYTVGSRQLILSKGDLIVLNKKTPHIVDADLRKNDYERYTLMFDLDLMSSTGNDFLFAKFILGENNDTVVFKKSATQTTTILPLLQKIEKLVLSPNEFLDVELHLLTLQVAEQINHLIKNNAPAEMSTNQHIEKILNYINENIYSNISLTSLAKDLFLSPYYVSHIFSKHMKTSIKNYINLRKMHIAEEMISQGTLPTVAARQLGFEYYSTFFNLYKKTLGKAPSEG